MFDLANYSGILILVLHKIVVQRNYNKCMINNTIGSKAAHQLPVLSPNVLSTHEQYILIDVSLEEMSTMLSVFKT
jgi:hypothetical protein